MHLLKYFFFLVLSIIGNPFYQMFSYLLCAEFDYGTTKGTNVYQVNPLAFILFLVLIYLARLAIYSLIFTSNKHPFRVKGDNSFLYIFSERHLFYFIGLITFFIWISPLEGNIIGFFVFPINLFLGLLVSVITIVRLWKTKKIWIAKSTSQQS